MSCVYVFFLYKYKIIEHFTNLKTIRLNDSTIWYCTNKSVFSANWLNGSNHVFLTHIFVVPSSYANIKLKYDFTAYRLTAVLHEPHFITPFCLFNYCNIFFFSFLNIFAQSPDFCFIVHCAFFRLTHCHMITLRSTRSVCYL